jgi:D-alanyl-D-alanine dipeptidase
MKTFVIFSLLAIIVSNAAVSWAAPEAIPAPNVKEFNLLTHALMSFEQREGVAAGTSDEPMVDVRKYDSSIFTSQREDMLPYTGEMVLVRDSVAKKLAAVNARLNSAGYGLKVVYGYRHPEIQTKYFESRKAQLKKEWDEQGKEYSENELNRRADVFAAYPPLAGHTTGGCVDIRLVRLDDGKELDCTPAPSDPTAANGTGDGTPEDKSLTAAEAEEVMRTFSSNITPQQLANRLFMHDAMLAEGFAPFYGEWWHFMYGDREWAAFVGEKAALYAPVIMTPAETERIADGRRAEE